MDNQLGLLLEEIHKLETVVAEKINQTKKTLTYEIEHGRAVFRPDTRTEQCWCSIKHAKMAKGCHSRSCLFCKFGDAEGYGKKLRKLRMQFDDLQAIKS